MKIYKLDMNNIDSKAIAYAADAIRRGELVIFPTETVYGLAADALNEDAVKKVYAAKKRNSTQSLPVQISSIGDIRLVADDVPECAYKLADAFWPGPLTMILKKNKNLSDMVTGGLDTVGVRVPDHAVALALLNEIKSPIIATSANISASKPATNALDVSEELGEHVEIVLDAGESRIGLASTVIDVSVNPPKILRSGVISAEDIRNIIGAIINGR